MSAIEERQFWNAQASPGLESAQWAIWAEGGAQEWVEGIGRCLALLLPALRATVPLRRVLDLGCGVGRMTVPVAKIFPEAEIIGVDCSAEMLELARVGEVPANVSYRLGDGRHIPVEEPLDAAWSMLCFQHIPRLGVAGYLAQIGALLRPGGRVRFQYVEGDTDVFLCRDLHEADVAEMCEGAGLSIEALSGDTAWGVWRWATARR